MATTKAKGEFKNKITKAQEDLFKALDTEKEKHATVSSKIVSELNKQGKANVKELSLLNKEYLDHCLKNDGILQTFIDKVKKINDDLDLAISTYKENYNVDKEEEKLIDAKDKVVAPLKTRFKREIHDINIKIDRIDKELKETLEQANKTIEDEANDYKEKLIDFEKRKRFDINKIQNNTIKAYDEIQKLLLAENKRKEIMKHKKAIKEIRYQGLIEEKECLLKYCDDQLKFEQDYLKHELESEINKQALQKDYSERIENTKYDRSMIEYNFKKEFDRYDNEAIHNLNIVNKDMEYKQNAMKEILYKQIYEEEIKALNNETKKHDDELKVVSDIYNNIYKLDEKQVTTYLDLNSKDLASIDNDLKLFSKNINLTLNFYLTNILSIYHSYFKELFHKEEHFLTNLLSNAIEGEFLNGFNNEIYVNKLTEIFTSFTERENTATLKFEEILKNLLTNLLNQVEIFITSLNEMNNQIHAQVNMYHDNMKTILTELKDSGINYYTNIYNTNITNVNNKLNDNQKLYDTRLSELALEKENFDKEFVEREDKVKQVEIKNDKNYQELMAGYNSSRDENMQVIKAKYDEEVEKANAIYLEKKEKIDQKFALEKVEIEKEYKVKMGLL